jgi:Lon protease-like protein
MKEFELSGLLQSHIRETALLDSVNLKQFNVPLFVSGKVILPGQSLRLPIFEADHVRMFRNALVPSSRYNSLCLAAVHRCKPEVAQFGTIIQIVGVEHRSDAIIIDVVGIDRFKLEIHYEEDESTINGNFELLHEETIRQLSIELPNAPAPNDELGLIKQREHITQYSIDLAGSVIQFIHNLGGNSSVPTNVLHTQTSGLLGPQWLQSMIATHGPIPPKEDPIAVVWWVAAVLPNASSEIYILLRTIPIIDRLELVIAWLQNLQSQWETCRNTAINAFNLAAAQHQT